MPTTFHSAKLLHLRKARRWSPHDLSVELSLYARKRRLTQAAHPDTIKNWERGKTYPDADLLCALADIFQVPVASLFVTK